MAMASAFVDGTLEDTELLWEYFLYDSYRLKDLQVGLRNLRTFLLCAKGGGNSSVLGSLLSGLEDSLIQNSKDFHDLCLRQKEKESRTSSNLKQEVNQLDECIKSFSQKIIESYITLSDYCSLHSVYQMKEFFDSLLVNMADILRDPYFRTRQDPKLITAFKDRLVFFINFFRFAELRGFEPCQLQVLLAHVHVVAINAARLCYQWPFVPYHNQAKFFDEFRLKVSEPLLKIKTVSPQIREIYVHVLTASNVSRSSSALTLDTDKHVLGDFVDTLLCNILEALTYDDSYMVSLKDQIPILYEGLRFLRSILTEHLEKIDGLHQKEKDLIGAAVDEAAIVICLLPETDLEEGLVKKIDLALLNFLERIKIIKVITSAYIFSKTNENGFIDFLLENLKELPSCKVYSIASAKDQIQTLQEDLVSLISLLESILDQQNRDGKLQSLWSRVANVAYKTRVVIESLVVGDMLDCSPLEFNPIIEEINLIKTEAFKIGDSHYSSEAQKVDKASPSPSHDSPPEINKIEGTLDDEANKIIGLLIRGSKPLDIISIVGMPGLGKTTLARRVYDDPSVTDHFHARAWCVVSHLYKKKELLLRILGSVDPNFSADNYSKKNEEELEEMLKKCLLKRRYLIVLDDVWDTESWSSLEKSFPNDANSSRILITSRLAKVAKEINPNSEPHFLRLLTDDESWNLLQKKLAGKESYPSDLGKRIATNCKGLPLTIVIVAGILANLELDGWADIARRLSLSDLPILDQCMDMLEMSYKNLSENLKSCLLYFAAFREDEEIPCKRLIWLWMAEGFVQKSEAKSLEDVARDCINNLISRSLVMVSEERSIGGVKTCRIHDMLHEFCVVKAKKNKFMSVLNGRDEIFTFQVQRLCVHATLKHFVRSVPFSLGVRSLLFFPHENPSLEYHGISHIFHFFKLKVLDLMQFRLNSDFPREILLLVELRYLAIKAMLRDIPTSIDNLSNLETLVLVDDFSQAFFLPITIWNMSKLRVLWSNGTVLRSILDDDNLQRSSSLHNLDIFSLLKLSRGQSMEKIMRKVPNIRRLKCQLFQSRESNADCNRIVVIDFLSRLESLHLRIVEMDKYHIGFRFPLNLKKLTLSGFHSTIIPKRGELLNLVVLKLDSIHYGGNAWDMNEEWEFPNLKFLKLDSLRIDRWSGTDGVDHFPCLEKLVLRNCRELKEVPSYLGYITSLQMIEVSDCPKSVASLIMQIQDDQKDNFGTEDLQVLLTNISDNEVEAEPSKVFLSFRNTSSVFTHKKVY